MGKGIGCKIYENCGRDCTHCAAEEAKKKARKMAPRKTTMQQDCSGSELYNGYKNI